MDDEALQLHVEEEIEPMEEVAADVEIEMLERLLVASDPPAVSPG